MKKTARTRLIEERKRQGWSQQELADHLGTTRHNVSRWEAGLTTPGPYFRTKLSELFGISARELGLLDKNLSSSEREAEAGENTGSPSAESLALWTVPYLRNPHFTGREELFAQLDQQFSASEKDDSMLLRQAALTQPQAIKGLGGIGKTQIAVEYAYRAREQGRYTHIVWINAASEEAIITSFVALAEMIPAFAATTETDQRKLVVAIIRWLELRQERWLLIFDNADDVTLLEPYLPHRGNGHLLFTTRAQAVGAFAASIDVEKMGLVEGTLLLLHRAQREHASDEDSNEATNIVIALDGFPLALDQAGAYIEETGCGLSNYLQTYQQHRQALLARRGKQATNYPDSVATTWSLSFARIEQSNPAAAELLQLCAFLAPDAIPEELLTEGAAYWPPLLQQAAADRFSFNHLLESLLSFSLIKRQVQEQVLSLHRLVQVVQRDAMSQEQQQQWAERVVRAVHKVFPRDPKEDVASWPRCLRYLEQAQACDTLIQQYKLLLPEAAELLDRTGTYLNEHASYSLAEPLFQRALFIREVQMAFPLNNLAGLYLKQGKHEQAESLFQRALSVWEQQLGSEHRQVAYPLNGLANLYFEQGKYEQAASLSQRALSIWEQQLGPDHPDVATSLTNLANIYQEQGRYEEVKPLYQRALRIYEQQLGPEHPNVANLLNRLANLYYREGKYGEAEPLYKRALRIREQQLGPGHPDVASPLINLANIYAGRGKYKEAESLYKRALDIWERGLGPEHPNVAYPLNVLANVYQEQGRYEEAEPLYKRALRIREQQLGPEHPSIAHLLTNLAALYQGQGKYGEAELLYQRALHICEQQLGPEHPDVAHPLYWLASLYCEQGKYEQAECLYQRALRIREQQLGPEHPLAAYPLNDLANLYALQGKYLEAGALFQRALHIREQALGKQHFDTAETLHDFAAFRETQGELQEALLLYQRALTIREQSLGETHPMTMETRTKYLALLHTTGGTDEAMAMKSAASEETSS